MAVTDVKTYQAFRGVDYSASPAVISERHASDLMNMYIGEDGVLQKRPGWHILKTFQASSTDLTRLPINGIHFIKLSEGNGTLLIHAGTRLYSVLIAKSWRHVQGKDEPYFQYQGDVPTMEDVQLIRDYVTSGVDGIEPWQVKNMDIDGDGRVTLADAKLLEDFVADAVSTASNGVLPTSYSRVLKENGSALELQNTKTVSFVHDGKLYLLDGIKYYVIAPQYGGTSNLLDISSFTHNGVIQQDGTYED